ncbi:alpha-ketoglutarate decarboxylase [Aquimarina sp. 2201CG1-2-11]|uniref:alpha-ketoglutarate decarboxylase n=1 Tax=Aquimarina discodermiae TaxID=3231043 RepID=UPI0034622C57
MKTNHFLKIVTFTSLLTLLLTTNKGISQEADFWSNVRFGGNLNIGFSNDTFNAIVAPSAIYQVNDWFSTGLGLSFGYSSFNDDSIDLKRKSTNYGGSIITLLNPIPELQLSAEFEEMGVHQQIEINEVKNTDTYWYPALFVGAGFRSGPVTVGLRYDLLFDEDKSIYGSAYAPFVRVFF